MRKHSIWRWFSHCSLLLIPLIVFAESIVEGPVSGTWEPGGNPYIMSGSISIEPGQTLLIKPGVIVYIESPDTIKVYGTLIAQGLQDDSIRFIGITEQPWSGIWFYSTSGSASTLNYVTIQTPQWGLVIQSSQPTIQHCTIKAQSVAIFGLSSEFNLMNSSIFASSQQVDAIRLLSSDASVYKCEVLVIGTSSDLYAAGIRAEASNPVIQYSTFRVESAGICYGLYMEGGPRAEFSYNLFDVRSENPAYGAMISNSSTPEFINNTISIASPHPIDKGMYLFNSSSPYIENCILYGDGTSQGIEAQASCSPEIVYSDVYNNSPDLVNCHFGEGCFSQDPLFIEPAIHNYQIGVHSPCIDAGNFTSPPDPDLSRADLGCFYYNSITNAPTQNLQSPQVYGIITAFPNPFNANSRLEFNLTNPLPGTLAIYNAQGQLISLVKNGVFDSGINQYIWDATHFSSGTYWAILTTRQGRWVQTLCLIK